MKAIKAILLIAVLWLGLAPPVAAHHILGRPAYSLNEDSNTPSSIQGEALVEDFMVTFMVFPAFPKPGEPGRIHLYIKPVDGSDPFQGKVAFKVEKENSIPFLGNSKPAPLGVQPPDSNVFRQSFKFSDAGDYLVTAEFKAGGKPLHVDFALRVGAPPALGLYEILFALLVAVIVIFGALHRKRAMTAKIRAAHDQDTDPL
jgi:hypothetical protein